MIVTLKTGSKLGSLLFVFSQNSLGKTLGTGTREVAGAHPQHYITLGVVVPTYSTS